MDHMPMGNSGGKGRGMYKRLVYAKQRKDLCAYAFASASFPHKNFPQTSAS